MIEIKGISFSYGKSPVISNITFTAQAGECVGILGNNGVGKSTLITCVNQIRKPMSGDVLINGKNTKNMSKIELARNVSYVAQKNEMDRTTVFDSVLLGRKPYIKWAADKKDIDICGEMIERVGLNEMQFRSLDELSGGELQKVMLARALVQEPKIMLLDEPTSNLDPKNQYEMMALVKEIAAEKKITVLIVIHDLNLAVRYCDKFYFIKNGEGYQYGGIEIVTEDVIESVYGIKSQITDIGGRKVVSIG